MSKYPSYWSKAIKTLTKRDKVLKKLIIKYNDKFLTTRKDIFYSLCKSIVGQQISVSAANSVFKKFQKKTKRINPLKVSKLSISQLKSCGLSRQKALGIKELSVKFVKKEFDPKLIKNMNDEEAIQYLSSLRQIGRWSAEMILLFTYNRSNIWPLQDIGLLRAISNNYKKKYFPPKSFLNKLYKNYSKLIPEIGKIIVGKKEPYQYLIKSIENFVNQNELIDLMRESKFDKCDYTNLSGGIVSIHSGWKI